MKTAKNKTHTPSFHHLSTVEDIEIRTKYGVISGFTCPIEDESLEDYLANHVLEESLDEIIDHLKMKYGERTIISVLQNLWVDDDCQGQGHGKHLMNKYLQASLANGASVMVLIVDYEQSQRPGFKLTKFYEIHGFDETEWTYESGFMIKRI